MLSVARPEEFQLIDPKCANLVGVVNEALVPDLPEFGANFATRMPPAARTISFNLSERATASAFACFFRLNDTRPAVTTRIV
jgi:hypothetical protein